jgi:hypothetical protein
VIPGGWGEGGPKREGRAAAAVRAGRAPTPGGPRIPVRVNLDSRDLSHYRRLLDPGEAGDLGGLCRECKKIVTVAGLPGKLPGLGHALLQPLGHVPYITVHAHRAGGNPAGPAKRIIPEQGCGFGPGLRPGLTKSFN